MSQNKGYDVGRTRQWGKTRQELIQFLVEYEVASSWWWVRWMPWRWTQQWAAGHFVRKVQRKMRNCDAMQKMRAKFRQPT